MLNAVYKKIVFNLLKGLDKGKLTVTLPDGEKRIFGREQSPKADMQILDNVFFEKTVLHGGDIGLGEAYVEKNWQTSNLCSLLNWFLLNRDSLLGFADGKKNVFLQLLRPLFIAERWLRRSSIKNAPKNIEEHYDVSNNFFQLILDPTMTYSSALFNGKDVSLQKAQEMKYQRICDIANIEEKDHVLEIGGGWAGFAIYASQNYGCKVSSITISPSQHSLGNQRIKKAGLENKISYDMMDYRDVKGKFDKVVSIEMIEAVGWQYLKTFFSVCERVLKPGGILVLQAILCPDSRYDYMKKNPNWIQKYIFPGSFLPSVKAMLGAISMNHELFLYDLKDMGHDYAKTLNLWANRLKEKEKEVKKLGFDETFIRKWEYYFRACQVGFDSRHISVGQLVFSRPNEAVHYS